MSFAILRIHPAQVAVLAGSTLVLALLVHETRDVLETDYRAQVESIQASVDKTAERLAALTSETFDQVSRSTLVVNFVQGRRPAPTPTELELAGVIDRRVADRCSSPTRRATCWTPPRRRARRTWPTNPFSSSTAYRPTAAWVGRVGRPGRGSGAHSGDAPAGSGRPVPGGGACAMVDPAR